MREHDLRIDLIKLIATAMVVILHTFENGGGIQQYLYLIGVYGIPLFFMVNGYLLCDKDYTLSYLKKKLFQYGRFLILWCLVIGVLAIIKDQQLIFGIQVFTDVFIGTGWLFHLWFIITLMIIHTIYWIIYSTIKKCCGISIDKVFQWWLPFTLIVMMNTVFLFDIFYLMPDKSLIVIVPIPYRLVRYFGYFVLGLCFGKLKKRETKCTISNWLPFLIVAVSYIALCIHILCVEMSEVWSTNTFYPSVFCAMGTIAIFFLCMRQNTNKHSGIWRTVNNLAPSSIGIWVLHPFVLAFFRKLLELISVELTLTLRILMVPVVFVGCLIISKISLRIKGVQILFHI